MQGQLQLHYRSCLTQEQQLSYNKISEVKDAKIKIQTTVTLSPQRVTELSRCDFVSLCRRGIFLSKFRVDLAFDCK